MYWYLVETKLFDGHEMLKEIITSVSTKSPRINFFTAVVVPIYKLSLEIPDFTYLVLSIISLFYHQDYTRLHRNIPLVS